MICILIILVEKGRLSRTGSDFGFTSIELYKWETVTINDTHVTNLIRKVIADLFYFLLDLIIYNFISRVTTGEVLRSVIRSQGAHSVDRNQFVSFSPRAVHSERSPRTCRSTVFRYYCNKNRIVALKYLFEQYAARPNLVEETWFIADNQRNLSDKEEWLQQMKEFTLEPHMFEIQLY